MKIMITNHMSIISMKIRQITERVISNGVQQKKIATTGHVMSVLPKNGANKLVNIHLTASWLRFGSPLWKLKDRLDSVTAT